jgi:hypothetical protein
MLRALLSGLLSGAGGLGALLAWFWLRPNRAQVDPRLGLASWDLVADGEHNSNTDLIRWRGQWLLVHAASPYHMGTPRSRLVIRRCADALPAAGSRWETLAELRVPGSDIRDPIFAPIGERLLLYALTNQGFYATPSGTVLAASDDGARWSEFEAVGPPGWLFWRVRPHPSEREPGGGPLWYASAYWKDHGESILLRSADGRAWDRVASIHRGEANDETEITFLPGPDGAPTSRMLATARLEVSPDSLAGHPDASTLLAFSDPPYREWSDARKLRSRVTRLDGPVSFADGGRLFAVARAQPGPRRWPLHLGSSWARKRTALFWIDPGREAPGGTGEGEPRLVRLSDLPSAGDTSYAGVVLHEGALYADYYTSRVDRDYPWLLGMLLRSDIRMARIPLEALHRLAEAHARR